MKRILYALRFLGSLQFGMILLIALFALIFWGTLFEARAGLDLGVSRFFDSWILWVAGILPFPALKSLAVLLFIHLLFACIFCLSHSVRKFGMLLVHFSILILIAGSFAGSQTRESFQAFGLVGSEVWIDSTVGASFAILDADSVSCTVLPLGSVDTIRTGLNVPQTIGPYTMYFGETFEITPQKKVVRFFVKRDPFAFAPFLFAVMLLVGLVWHGVAVFGGRKR